MLAKDALAALESYSFPGNVRELENILERAITLSTPARSVRRTFNCGPRRRACIAGASAKPPRLWGSSGGRRA